MTRNAKAKPVLCDRCRKVIDPDTEEHITTLWGTIARNKRIGFICTKCSKETAPSCQIVGEKQFRDDGFTPVEELFA